MKPFSPGSASSEVAGNVPATSLLDHLKSALPDLGVTRLARITGLDRVGMPVWAVVRPNALTLSVNQGKGLTDEAAQISALMEALELASVERRHPRAFDASQAGLEAKGGACIDVGRYVRPGWPAPPSHVVMRWLEGCDLVSGAPIFVPEAVVLLSDGPDDGENCPFWQSSDGLGAGETADRAILHALCERVERDATALAALRTPDEIAASEVAPAAVGSPDLDGLADQIQAAGLALRLFDFTSNLGIPTFLALVHPNDRPVRSLRYFDLAGGTGTHPLVSLAALSAVTEAVQTRLTIIAGARDDFEPEDYGRGLPASMAVYLRPRRPDRPACRIDAWDDRAGQPHDRLDRLVARLGHAGIGPIVVVPLADEFGTGLPVVRVLTPGLEDDPRSHFYRPRRRALAAMLGQR